MTTLAILFYLAMLYLIIGAAFAVYMARKTLDWSGLLGFLLFWPYYSYMLAVESDEQGPQ